MSRHVFRDFACGRYTVLLFLVAPDVEFIMYEIVVFVAIVWVVIQLRKWLLLRPMMQSLESKHVVVSKIK